MNKLILLFSFLLFVNCASTQKVAKDKQALTNALNQSAKDWSIGSLEDYMNAYWKSEELQFIGSNGITYGWETTLANYKKSYPTKEDMGVLNFEILEITFLSKNVYSVVGKYFVNRSKGKLEGVFSVIFKKIDGQWRIVSDHSE